MKRVIVATLATLIAAASASAQHVPPAIARVPVVLLVDTGAGQVLYARQPELRFVPASMAKVMSAYTAFEMIRRQELSPDQRFTMSPQTFATWNGKGTSMHLQSGESVPVSALLHGITTVSANDGAVLLAEGAAGSVVQWSALMNAEARRIGLTCSHFATPNGWPDNGATYVCADDLVKLGGALIQRHPALYRQYFGHREMSWKGVVQQNKDPTLGIVRGADGIKTGHTREAGYNFLGSAARDGRRLIMVIGGAKSEAQRAGASRALLEWGFSAWRNQTLFGAGSQVAEARVQEGTARSVPLITERAISTALPARGNSVVVLRVTYRGPLCAPITRGTKVAELEIAATGTPPVRVPLLAGSEVARAGPLDRLRNGLMGLFS